MGRLSDIDNGAVRNLLGTRCLAAAILAINAGGAATVKTTNAIATLIGGIFYSKALLAAQSIVPTHDTRGGASRYEQPPGTTAYLTLGVNAAGAVAVVQGTYLGQKFATDPMKGVGNGNMMGSTYTGDGLVPALPPGYAPFGLIKVVTGSAPFTPGVTALDAANITVSFYDIAVIPAVGP